MRVEGWIGHANAARIGAFKRAVINDPDGPVKDCWRPRLPAMHCRGLRGDQVKGEVK